MTITEFNILKNKTKGMWRKEKQLGFPVQFTQDQVVEWILLGEHYSINEYLPFHQTTGKRKAPSWIESCTNSNYQFRMPTKCCTPNTAEKSPTYEVAITKKVLLVWCVEGEVPNMSSQNFVERSIINGRRQSSNSVL